MHKPTLISALFAVLFAGSTIWLYRHNERARLASHELCTQQIARLQSDYQAEIEELQYYILQQYQQAPDMHRPALTPTDKSWDKKHEQAVDRKYRFLFPGLNLSHTDRESLRQLLLERDYITGLVDIAGQSDKAGAKEESREYEAHMSAIDERIGNLLDTPDYLQYEMLRESTVEQHHLDEYAGNVSKVAAISPVQEKTILLAKLRHKQIYNAILQESGLHRENLSPAERARTLETLQQALSEYKDNYLHEVKPLLEEEQFILLNNYETTEFNWELERLRIEIDARN